MVSADYLDNILNLLMTSKALAFPSAMSKDYADVDLGHWKFAMKWLRYTLGIRKRSRGRIERASVQLFDMVTRTTHYVAFNSWISLLHLLTSLCAV